MDSQKQLETDAFRDFWKIQNPIAALREGSNYITQGWAEMSTTLTSLAEDADLILTGTTYQEVAANVAEYQRIPLAALHYFPHRANSRVLPIPLPLPLIRAGWAVGEWAYWRLLKEADDAQRRELGLPKSSVRSMRRIVEAGALEIQAYDELFFPGLAKQWGGTRPFVGALTLELTTQTDDQVASWVAAGEPPIYFGFGSMPVDSPAEAVAMIESVCAELGQRALICTGDWNLQRHNPKQECQGRARSESCGGVPRLPRGRPPWRRRNNGRGHTSRSAHIDLVGRSRPARLGDSGQAAESRHRSALFEDDPRFAARLAPVRPRTALQQPRPCGRSSDVHARRECYKSRRFARSRRPQWLCLAVTLRKACRQVDSVARICGQTTQAA